MLTFLMILGGLVILNVILLKFSVNSEKNIVNKSKSSEIKKLKPTKFSKAA